MPDLTRIIDRDPTTDAARIVAHLRPPRQFADATFESYVPDAAHPSQAQAVDTMQAMAASWQRGQRRSLFRKAPPEVKPGVYLDGGFGVGKTHLLVALWKTMPGTKHFGTFIEYTALVGALGYKEAVQALSGASIVCIDEFELDDPGDTMVMTRLLGELVAGGAKIAATSNTPPNALGEGRFAAQDFLREIQAISDRFEILRIDGDDYRQRDISGEARALADDAALDAAVDGVDGSVAVDDFVGLVDHLRSVHPSRFVDLVDGLDAVGWRDVRTLTDQAEALRLVALVDRLYDAQVRILASGTPLSAVFSDEMLSGGYRKKYLRATSRLIALTSAGA